MATQEPFGLGAVGKKRWARAQSHEAGFWQQQGIMDDQRRRVASRYEDVVRKLAASAPGDSCVLEVGCGPTCAARVFPGASTVFLDPLMRVYRPRVTPGTSGAFVCAVGERLPFADSQFDFTFSFNVLDHVLSPTRFIAELRRVTRPGGRIAVGVYTHPRLFAVLRNAIDRLLPVFGEDAHPYFLSRESLVAMLRSQALRVDQLLCVHASASRPSLHRQDWVAISSRV